MVLGGPYTRLSLSFREQQNKLKQCLLEGIQGSFAILMPDG